MSKKNKKRPLSDVLLWTHHYTVVYIHIYVLHTVHIVVRVFEEKIGADKSELATLHAVIDRFGSIDNDQLRHDDTYLWVAETCPSTV